MAAGDLAGSFQDEVTCSVCLEYFTDPVTIECGHNFCRACISQCWGESESNFSCPQCRETALQRNLRPNRQLGNLVELVKRLRLQAVTEPEGQRMCERHQEALKLFCEEDQTPICVVCDRSRAHRAHTVVPIEEAAQEYREQILSRLQHLQEEREELLGLKSDWDKESERLLRQTEVERQLVVFECEQLRQFLAEQERLLLARLGELDQEIGRRREENATHLCEEISQLSALITELEGKCQQPVPELLQGVRSAVRRGEKVMSPHPAPKSPELEKRIRDFPRENKLQEAVTGFLEGLAAERGLRRARGFAVDVTLDPDTANPNLVLSEDRKHVRHGDEEQALPDNPERFDAYPEVLGTEGFTGGRHYWEVEVGDKPDWMLGVCRDSVIRKGENDVSLEDGYWVVQLADGKYEGLTSPTTPLPVSVRPSRVGIFLDYEAGEVSFYNVTDRSHLYTFTGTFHGKLRPYFYPGLNAGGTKTAPLIICPVSAQAEGNLYITVLSPLDPQHQACELGEWRGAEKEVRKVKNKRETIAGEFNKLHTLLREEEQLLLQSLEEEEKETLQRLQENVTKLSQQSSSLQQLITEIEEKCQQPVIELLKDVKTTLSRSENVKLWEPEAVSTDLKNVYKIRSCLDMREILKRFAVDVTLDPDTAHPYLVLSEDRKRVRHGDKRQDLPNNPERFDTYPEVLGAEGFAGGRHYWEVEVGEKTGWDLGICRESVSRKGQDTYRPRNGYWILWLRGGRYKALTSPPTPFPVSVRPSRVGIFLDYEAGEVSFYNVTDRSHLFTFTDTFSGKLHPYFCPGHNPGGTNAAPLIICPVPAQAGGNLCP
ncbi:LOW QUALITY PROTEIN: E3 ubiquitin-protein ligase TRIM39-like [Mauremys mutica]|uniref:LOW QUALITY PROTEIN: E3 ubiquitin-protein ligase TRIM39-like n=1 Tax=Mauremys mutica TaxID=74926 RepID=UPI001D166916|nr:LOW QUALITY PROTEIN: E3 ubiquitin-protein ligase TRIM39-like [Mauremys mutica]